MPYDSEKKLHNDFGSGISRLCVFSSKNTTSFVSTSFKSSTALASAVSMPFYYLLELQHKLDQWVDFFCGSEKIRLKNQALVRCDHRIIGFSSHSSLAPEQCISNVRVKTIVLKMISGTSTCKLSVFPFNSGRD